jgi:acyl-ACP thioesterase
LAGDETLVSVTTLWLFIDLVKKKPRRIPPDWPLIYTIEKDDAIDYHLDGWKPASNGFEEKAVAITLRSSDFDPHGHVNNTVYFDFIETLLAASLNGAVTLEGLRIEFRREIARHVDTITAGFTSSLNGGSFRIYSGDKTFVRGEVDLKTPSVPSGARH